MVRLARRLPCVLLTTIARATMSTLPPRPSDRALRIEPPHIENVLDAYADIPDTSNLAMGVSHWSPPPNALKVAKDLLAPR
jgi:hypothetical protein